MRLISKHLLRDHLRVMLMSFSNDKKTGAHRAPVWFS